MQNNDFRIEHDSLGEVKVPSDKLWGAQTERSRHNFVIGEKMPYELVKAIVIVKRACALANEECGKLSKEKRDAIMIACDKILKGGYEDSFPLVVFQTGSGTQTNMNVNEVLAHLSGTHPNDDCNMSQSTNDVFPTAIHVMTLMMSEELICKLGELIDEFKSLEKKYDKIVKTGRTHLQDATPISFSAEISAWRRAIEEARFAIENALEAVRVMPLGGTAVGSGLNTPEGYANIAVQHLGEYLGECLFETDNKYHGLAFKDALVLYHGALKNLACSAMKIANDVRWLSSGPRCGIGEITIPANEPGSSIMPGKVNPTQCEALTMVACEVLGNDATISFAASQGNFELNVFMPVIAFKINESIKLLTQAIGSFSKHCVNGIKPNEKKMTEYLHSGLMLATAFSPYIGYEKAANLVHYAFENDLTVKEAALKTCELSEAEIDKIIENALKAN
ncbi:MAG: class II fumarate hydratase [Eubacteriales bacterium]|nr:class II fumarate hydratase [Bacillota bacterium]MDY5345467.1 class II fumarate hydratase [Eubacteriales bacterium]